MKNLILIFIAFASSAAIVPVEQKVEKEEAPQVVRIYEYECSFCHRVHYLGGPPIQHLKAGDPNPRYPFEQNEYLLYDCPNDPANLH